VLRIETTNTGYLAHWWCHRTTMLYSPRLLPLKCFWEGEVVFFCHHYFSFFYPIQPNLSYQSAQFSSVAQSCPTLCNPMNRSTPGLPVHHQLLEFTQTHVHRVGDAIQPSHPLSAPSPPAPILRSFKTLLSLVISSKFYSSTHLILAPCLIYFIIPWHLVPSLHGK